MKLTMDQIFAITTGAVRIEQTSDGFYHFERFTPEQREAFTARNENFIPRIISTSGVRLDFYTDARTVLVETLNAGPWEVLVNGLSEYYRPEQGRITVSLPEGENRVTVLLSSHKPTTLKFIQTDEGASIRPYTYNKKFLFLGDSITQGSSASRPSLQYSNRLSQFYDAQVLNWGVGGSRFFPETVAVVDYDPDVIFLAYGTNDYTLCQSADLLKDMANTYMDRVKALYPGKPVICIGPLWRADVQMIRPSGTHRQVCDQIRQLALDHGFTFIEGYELVPHNAEYFADGYLHPNDLGFSMYAQNLIKKLSQ